MPFIDKGVKHHCPGRPGGTGRVDGYPGNCRILNGYCNYHQMLCPIHTNFCFCRNAKCEICEGDKRRIEKEKQERRDRGDPSDDDTPRSPPKKGKKLSGWKKVIADAKNKESSKGKSKNTKTPVQKTGKTKPGKNTKAAKETRAYLANDPMLYTVDNTKCIGIDPDLNERMYPTASSRVSSKRKGVDSLSFLDDPAVEILFQARRQSNRIAARRAGSKSFVKSTLGAKGSWVFGK